MPMEPESPGEIPKTVRPLPNDLDAALRAACTNVVRNNKPSHEYHKGGKAQLDYATIRRGGGSQPQPAPRKPENPSAALSKADSNEERRQAKRESLSTGLVSPDRSQRMSHISASAAVHSPTQDSGQPGVVQRSRAQSRADQLMGGASPHKPQSRVDQLMGSPPKIPRPYRDRTDSHSRSQSTPQPFWTAPPPIAASVERPKPAPRAHSMETTGSTPQKEPTGYEWSADTTATSAANIPARSTSLRNPVKAMRSGAEARNVMKVDTYDAEWMREESEKRRLLQQQAYAEAIATRHATWTGPNSEFPQEEEDKSEKSPENGSQTTTPVITVPARKPVPTTQTQCETSQEPDTNQDSEVKSEPEEPSSPELDLTLTDPSLLDINASKPEEPAPAPQRSGSRMGRGRTRGTGVPMNSRAASRARSITREVKEFMRNASRSRQPRAKGDESQGRSRRPSLSRTRDAVVDYFRPGTAMGASKQSLDIPRNAADLKSKSHESLISARSAASAAKDTPMQQNSQRSSQHNQHASIYTGPLSRNSSDGGDGEAEPRRNLSISEVPQRKSQVDLNRALPPLPRLDSWHGDGSKTPDTPPEPPKHASDPPRRSQESALPSPGLASTIALQQNTTRDSGRSPLPSPGLASTIAMQSHTRDVGKSPLPSPKLPDGVHDFVALRMGAPVPVSRQSSRAKMSREHMNPNLVHQTRSSRGKRNPADPRHTNLQAADTKTLTTPSTLNLAKRGDSQASRRRSRSVQEVNPPDLSAKLRQASANAPDGRSIHAVGQAKLINTTPSRKESDNLATKLGRKLSTRTKRNVTPTANQQPPVPPPHRELHQQKANRASHTPPGISRNNSEYPSSHRHSLSRKMSMEEYGRMYDGRHQRQAEALTTPPPAAVANSKSSPLMGLGNFLPSKHQQQPSQQQANGSKKWWHLGLGKEGEKDQPMDQVSRNGGNTDGGLGVRY